MHLMPDVFLNLLISKGAEKYEDFMKDQHKDEKHDDESYFPLPYLLVLLG
jgi:hypothetical protein